MENFHLQTFFYMRLLLQTIFFLRLPANTFFTCIQFFSVITVSANNLFQNFPAPHPPPRQKIMVVSNCGPVPQSYRRT